MDEQADGLMYRIFPHSTGLCPLSGLLPKEREREKVAKQFTTSSENVAENEQHEREHEHEREHLRKTFLAGEKRDRQTGLKGQTDKNICIYRVKRPRRLRRQTMRPHV